MKKSDMLECMINYYCDGNKSRFAEKLGIKPQTINSWIVRNTFDAELVYANCEGISSDWLLSGEGEMLREQHSVDKSTSDKSVPVSVDFGLTLFTVPVSVTVGFVNVALPGVLGVG